MSPQGVVVERSARHTADYTAADRADAPTPRGAGTFVYASGTRPLEGYTIKRGVGQGGFGEIYYATSDAGKEVALKLVRRNLEVELRGMRQCLNLKHPNLVDLYDIRQDEQGNTWVVMEFVAGQSLEDALAERPDGFPLPEAMAWMHGIAAGVAYLHDRGIVHRDLKPGNIFCETVVKIGDYGLSKFISSSRRSGHTESIGTVHYMAPEVANGRYGKEIDIYALGVILFELLTGRVPFDGESVGEVLMKHLTAQPDLSMLEEPYWSVVARALEKDPNKRFGSVNEMMAALPPSPGGAVVGWIPSSASTGGGSAVAPGQPPIPPGTEPPRAAEALPDDAEGEEPVWQFVREQWQRLRLAWDRANLSLPRKMGVLFLAVVAFFVFAGYLIPLAFVAGLAYLGYRLVRPILVAYHRLSPSRAKQQPPPVPRAPTEYRTAASPVRPASPSPQARTMAYRSAEPEPPIVGRSLRQRVTELVGSLVVGALVAMAMSVVVILIDSYWKGNVRPQQCAWLVLMGIAGTWSVLAVSKFWEYSPSEPLLRRFMLMLVGLGLGVASFAIADALLVDLPPQDTSIPTAHFNLPQSFYDAAGRPLAMAHMAVFGTLLALLRWWNQTDARRGSRMSLGSILFAVIGAAVAAGAWRFPQPWLIMVAAVMSSAVQLASPWLPPRARLRPQRKTVV